MRRQAGVQLRRIGVLSRDVGEPRIGSECGCECVCGFCCGYGGCYSLRLSGECTSCGGFIAAGSADGLIS